MSTDTEYADDDIVWIGEQPYDQASLEEALVRLDEFRDWPWAETARALVSERLREVRHE